MANDIDPGYESPSEVTAMNMKSEQSKGTQKHRSPLDPHNWAGWASPRRYFVAAMAFLGFYNIYATQASFLVAISYFKVEITVNGTVKFEDEFDWERKPQETMLNAFYYGYIISQIPGAYLASIHGPKKIFGTFILAETFITTFLSFINNYHVFIASRIIHGTLHGVTFPSLYLILSKWVPASEKSKLATAVISGAYFGICVTLPATQILMDKFNWQIAVESFSMISATWAILWLCIMAESPKTDPYITEDELNLIQSSINHEFSRDKMPLKVPWIKMLLSVPVWAIVIAHFCENWGFYTILRGMSIFMDDKYIFNVYNHFSGSLPYLAMGITVLLGGFIVNFIQNHNWLTTIQLRKIFNSVGFLGRAIFLILAAHSHSEIWSIINLTIALGFGGFAWSGFGVNHFDISPTYAGFLIALSNMFATLPAVISPSITDLLIGVHGGDDEWANVFYISSGLYIFGAVFYGICASSEVQSWSKTEIELESNHNDRTQNTENLTSME